MRDDHCEVGVEQHEFSDFIVRKAQASGNSPEQELQHMMDHDHMSSWMQEIRRNKALGLILAEATVTDADGAVVEVATAAPEAEADEDAEALLAAAMAVVVSDRFVDSGEFGFIAELADLLGLPLPSQLS